jgi:hypothetical protein
MGEEEAWGVYAQLPEGVPHVLHFRLATHGGVRPELTHPFVVSEESPLIERGVVAKPMLAHNGVWSLYTKQKELRGLAGPVSDSRVLAAWLGRLAKERPLREVLEERYEEVASAGRVVVVDPATWKIHVVGDWIREGPFLFSNGSYREDRFGLLKGACDWKEGELGLDLDLGVGVLKGPSVPKDLAEIAPPEPGPASLEEVEVAVYWGGGFSPEEANLTSYGNVYGWRVDENGMFVSPEGAVTPEEAARWLWLEDQWGDLLGEEEAEE